MITVREERPFPDLIRGKAHRIHGNELEPPYDVM